jgi:hypothetical protein
MQDEVAKHIKKIYSTMKESKFSFGEKLKETAIEIFIIVFAIMLSISLHDWSEHRHQQKEVKEFLVDLKDDLNKDIEAMTNLKGKYDRAIKEYTYLEKLKALQIDSIKSKKGGLDLHLDYIILEYNDGNYEGFKSSGKMGFIENKKLKKLTLKYYERSMPSLKNSGKYFETTVIELGNLVRGQKDENMFLDPKIKLTLNAAVDFARIETRDYTLNIKKAQEIISEIDSEIKE